MKIESALCNFLDRYYQHKIEAFYEERRALALEASKELASSPEYANYIKATNALKTKARELSDGKHMSFSFDIRDLTLWAPNQLFVSDGRMQDSEDIRFEHSQLLAQISLAKTKDEVQLLLQAKGILPANNDKKSTT